MTRDHLISKARPVLGGIALIALAATLSLAQKGGIPPQPPGPSVAGHWTGKITMILAASKREVTLPVNFQLEQAANANIVTGNLTMGRGNTSIPVKGIEENGKLNLVWDFSDNEHCRLHLTLEGDALSGNLYNFHDNPQKWDVDETGQVTLSRAQ